MTVSSSLMSFAQDTPSQQSAWMEAVQKFGDASALLVGLPAVGNAVVESLPIIALEAFDA